MKRVRGVFLVLALGLTAPGALAAQNSVYGIQGIGFPGRPISVYARSLGGGLAGFDAGSALNPATATGFNQVAVGLSIGAALRSYTAGDSSVSGLQETRFPFAILGSSLGATPVSLALSAGPYLERTFDVLTSDTVVIRGEAVAVTDRIASDGGAGDLRGALAVRLARRLLLGGAIHLISGSSALRVQRDFSSPAYRRFAERSQLTFSGIGASFGAVLRVSTGLELAASARLDHRLKVKRDTVVLEDVKLPRSLTGAVRLVPVNGVTLSSTATWRSWSDAAPDLSAGVQAFDTWEIGSGLELGAGRTGGAPWPIRLGLRYAQLPFSARPTQAHEWIVAAGTGLVFSNGAVAFDLAVERALRDGAGAREEAWQLSVGVLLAPHSVVR